jgi:radical SAM superfamily enzyme YgiQ (UPF0313 family)
VPSRRSAIIVVLRETNDSIRPLRMKVLLISTYELGRQPFGLASPAAWLARAGASVVSADLSRQPLPEDAVRGADLIAFYVPMHTATRLAVQVLPKVRSLNPHAHLCFYGLYASINATHLRRLGAETILGGEFEAGLVSTVQRLAGSRSSAQREPTVSLARQSFVVPDRSGLPPLARYSHLQHGDGKPRIAGYTEASRGCKHFCRHCPIVPVYNGIFRIVQRQVVLEDIRRQTAAGADHITFGDPDFFNGIRHAIELVTAFHREFPKITYDATIKIEHLLQHAEHLSTLRETGCLFVTSAVESVDDAVLRKLDKGHTFADFAAVVNLFRETGLALAPTFVAFTPWTTLDGYRALLARIAEMDLIEQVAPIQLAIRLLIPASSRLLELEEIRPLIAPFDEAALVYPWSNPDPHVDELAIRVLQVVLQGEVDKLSRRRIFSEVWTYAHQAAGQSAPPLPDSCDRVSRAAIPYLTEPWYC